MKQESASALQCFTGISATAHLLFFQVFFRSSWVIIEGFDPKKTELYPGERMVFELFYDEGRPNARNVLRWSGGITRT